MMFAKHVFPAVFSVETKILAMCECKRSIWNTFNQVTCNLCGCHHFTGAMDGQITKYCHYISSKMHLILLFVVYNRTWWATGCRIQHVLLHAFRRKCFGASWMQGGLHKCELVWCRWGESGKFHLISVGRYKAWFSDPPTEIWPLAWGSVMRRVIRFWLAYPPALL